MRFSAIYMSEYIAARTTCSVYTATVLRSLCRIHAAHCCCAAHAREARHHCRSAVGAVGRRTRRLLIEHCDAKDTATLRRRAQTRTHVDGRAPPLDLSARHLSGGISRRARCCLTSASSRLALSSSSDCVHSRARSLGTSSSHLCTDRPPQRYLRYGSVVGRVLVTLTPPTCSQPRRTPRGRGGSSPQSACPAAYRAAGARGSRAGASRAPLPRTRCR